MTTYNPTPAVAQLVATLRAAGWGVVLSDNSVPLSPIIERLGRSEDEVVTIGVGVNRGLACALNDGIAEAAARGARTLALWDQDSQPTKAFLDDLVASFEEESARGPVFLGATHVVPGQERPRPKSAQQRVVVDHLITASLISRTIDYEAVGPFREDFWVDMVDIEFCYRARHHGYRLLRASDLLFIHELGSASQARRVPGSKRRATSGHAVWRQYWIARNGSVLIQEYRRSEPDLVRRLLFHRIDWFGRVLLAGPHRLAVLRAVIAGLRDARTGAVSLRYSRAFEGAMSRSGDG